MNHLSGPPVVCLYFILVNNWNKTGLEMGTFLDRTSSSNIIYIVKCFDFPPISSPKTPSDPLQTTLLMFSVPMKTALPKTIPKIRKGRVTLFCALNLEHAILPLQYKVQWIRKKNKATNFGCTLLWLPTKLVKSWAAVFHRLIVKKYLSFCCWQKKV